MATNDFVIDVFKETVIKGNDVLFKCQVPSFVADFVQVQSWQDSEGNVMNRNEAYGNFVGTSYSVKDS